jgi:hypothetical protein
VRSRKNTALVKTAEQLGRTLGRAAGTLDHLRKRRHGIMTELDRLVRVARQLQRDLRPAARPARRVARIAGRALRRARQRI